MKELIFIKKSRIQERVELKVFLEKIFWGEVMGICFFLVRIMRLLYCL